MTNTVKEMRERLEELERAGYADFPVRILEVRNGLSLAHKVTSAVRGHKYDGEIVWLLTEAFGP